MRRMDFDETCGFLKSRDNFVILCHAFPDGDTIGSASALCAGLRLIGKKAYIKCAHDIPSKFSGIADGFLDCDFTEETVIAADVADPKLLGHLEEEYGKRVDLCIDHHGSNTGYAERLCLYSAAANCENIYNILVRLGVEPDKAIAEALFTGITTDTGCFKYENTTADTHYIAAKLMETGIAAGEINRLLFDTKSRARTELERMILDGMSFHFNDRCAVVTITSNMRKESECDDSDMDGISALARTIEGVMVGVTIRERSNGRYKISVRSHEPVDAAEICKELGGGGHKRAAGCELDGPLESAKEKLLAVIEGVLG